MLSVSNVSGRAYQIEFLWNAMKFHYNNQKDKINIPVFLLTVAKEFALFICVKSLPMLNLTTIKVYVNHKKYGKRCFPICQTYKPTIILN